MSNQDRIPSVVRGWTVKPVEIDDVPIVTLTLSSAGSDQDGGQLRRLADEMKDKLALVPDAGRIVIVGGQQRRLMIYPDPAQLAALNLSLDEVVSALRSANVNLAAGRFEHHNQSVRLDVGPAFEKAADVSMTPIKVVAGRTIHLRDVATITDGDQEAETYTRIGFGPAGAQSKSILTESQNAKGPMRLKSLRK